MNRNKTRKHLPPLSTVRLLEPGSGTATTELLRLAAPGVRNEQRAVVANEDVLDLLLTLFIDILLVEGDESLGDALTNGVNLGGVATALDADSHVHAGEPALPEKKDRLKSLEPEDFRFDELDGAAIDFDETAPSLAVGNGHRGLLATEALHLLQLLPLRHCSCFTLQIGRAHV